MSLTIMIHEFTDQNRGEMIEVWKACSHLSQFTPILISIN